VQETTTEFKHRAESDATRDKSVQLGYSVTVPVQFVR